MNNKWFSFAAGCVLLTSVQAAPPDFAAFLPPPLNEQWRRGPPVTGPADASMFGGGISTAARYTRGDGANDETCVITITGDAPMMQGLSMNFSNPAAAGLTGARVDYVGEQQIVITADGEVQALTNNYLTQYGGDCSHETKLAYVAITDFEALRAHRAGADAAATMTTRTSIDNADWAMAFGGPAKDWAYAMTGTHDGGLCTAGRTASKGAGLEDVWLVRVSGAGRLLWDRTYGGAAIDRARAIIETEDGHLVVAGATESRGAGEFDAWVLKLTASGEPVWERHFGRAATDWASAVVETRDGGYAVAAYTQDAPDAPFDGWVIKLDADGELQWQRRYGGTDTDWPNAIAETRDGGLVIVGHTESAGAGGADFWVLKLSAVGERLWETTFGGAGLDYASTVTATRDGAIIVGGLTRSRATGFDSRVLKLAADGRVIWDATLGGDRDDWIRAIVETRDGDLALAGYTMSAGAGLYDVWLLRLDADGRSLSERTFGAAGNEWARALVELPDGSLAMAGDTRSEGAGESDVLIIRVGKPAVGRGE